jgi:hypothetical protein
MDKAGHIYSSYHLGRLGLKCSNGVELAKRAIDLRFWYGIFFLTAVEVLDGFLLNGCFFRRYNCKCLALLYLSPRNYCGRSSGSHQNFLFIPHAQYRPNVLGSSLAEQMLKDYNGQTYWLSVNLHSFYKGSKSLNGLIWLLVMEQTEC